MERIKISDIIKLKDYAVHPEPREIYKKLSPLPKKGNFKIKTYVYGELYKNIAKIVFTKCIVNKECKHNIEIYIKHSGGVEVK